MANSAQTERKPIPKGLTPFKPGQSGNPNGRPKIAAEVKELALQACPGAIKRLIQIVEDDDEDMRVRIIALKELLDRGLGKPSQSVELTGAEGGPVQVAPVDAPPRETLEQYTARRNLRVIDMTKIEVK